MQIKDFVKLHFLVIIFGFTAILGKLIQIPAVETVAYRTGTTALIMGGIMYFSKKHKIIATRKTLLKLLGIGIIVAIHWILFFGATKVSNISICLVGISTTSFWTSIFEPLLTKKKFSWIDVLFGLAVVSGLYVIFSSDFDIALGLFMAIASAMFAALFSVLNFNVVNNEQVHENTITVFEMIGAFIGTFLVLPLYKFYFFPEEGVNFAISWEDAMWLGILSLVCTVYAYSASVEIMKRLSAFTVNLTINLEPVYGIVMAVIFFPSDETMSPKFYMGAGMILATVLCYPLVQHFLKRRAAKAVQGE